MLFYDSKRGELYKRKREKGSETIECNLFVLISTLGFASTRGLASVCIHTLSAIITQNVRDDARFCEAIDDPKGNSGEPANRVLALPIMGRDDHENPQFKLPKGMRKKHILGVIVAINKEGEQDFGSEDIENIKLYNCLAAKMIDITT